MVEEKCLSLLTKPNACSRFRCWGFTFNSSVKYLKSRWSRLHSVTPDHVFQQRWRQRCRLVGQQAGPQQQPTRPRACRRGVPRSKCPALRINVLLCHQRGYDPCNAAERVRSLKSYTRSISGRNVLAAARCLDAPETKIYIKTDWSGFVTGLTPDSAL